MFNELIRPVQTEIPAVPNGISTYCGEQLQFAVPAEFGIGITVCRSRLRSQVQVDIREDQNNNFSFLIGTIPYPENMDFVRAHLTTYGRSCPSQTWVEVDSTDLSEKYTYTKENIRRLSRVAGINYMFLIGENKDSVFVDGWLLKNLHNPRPNPSWRVAVPVTLDKMGVTLNEMGRVVIVPTSKFLIFANPQEDNTHA